MIQCACMRVSVRRGAGSTESCKFCERKANSLNQNDHWHVQERLDGLRGDWISHSSLGMQLQLIVMLDEVCADLVIK